MDNTFFPIDAVSDLIRQYKTHEKFQNDAKTLQRLPRLTNSRSRPKEKTGNQPFFELPPDNART